MIGSQELILILVILLVVFGPKKLPEMAKELGRAIQEFNKASSRAIQEFNKASSDITEIATPALKEEENEEKMVGKIAKNLGIDIEGKSTRQIIEEIERKTVKSKEDADIHENR